MSNVAQEKLYTLTGGIHTLPKGSVTLFLGAGASVAAGVPTTAQIIDEVLQRHFSAEQFQSLTESTKWDKFKELLRTQYRVQSARRSLFKPFFVGKDPSLGLYSLASQCQQKYFKCVFTTNFDSLLKEALIKLSLKEHQDFDEHIVGRGEKEDEGIIDLISSSEDLIHIVKLHGDYGLGIMPFSEIDWRFSTQVERFLVEYLKSHVVIFVGYSAYDEDLLFLFEQAVDPLRPVWWANSKELASDARIKDALINERFYDFFVRRNSKKNLIYGDEGNSENFFAFLEHRLADLRQEQEQQQPTLPMLVTVSEALVQHYREPGYEAPLMFYEGCTSYSYWAVIAHDLDIVREEHLPITQKVLTMANATPDVSLMVLKGPPGSGKTTSLLRLGYELAKNEALAVFQMKKYTRESFGDSLIRLGNTLSKPIIILVDDPSNSDYAITQTIKEMCLREEKDKPSLTQPIIFLIAATERELENTDTFKTVSRLRGYAPPLEVVSLEILQERDIEKLLAKWKEKCTGSPMVSVFLRNFLTRPPSEQKRLFLERARKQLLVALYEVTRNKNIEDILLDEFDGLPQVAQEVYLDVCLAYRYDILSPRSLSENKYDCRDYHFTEEILRPCRGIIYQRFWRIKEYHYGRAVPERRQFLRGRHPLIAKLVFENVIRELPDRFERFNSIVDVSSSTYSRSHTLYILSILEAMLREARLEPTGPNRANQISFNIKSLRDFIGSHWWTDHGLKTIVDNVYEEGDTYQLVRWGIFLNRLKSRRTLTEESLYCFEKACEINSDLPAAQYYRVMVLLDQGAVTYDDLAQAVRALASRLENNQITQSQRYFTNLLGRLKDRRDIEKIKLQIEALHIKPNHQVTYEGLRQSLQRLEDKTEIEMLLPEYLRLTEFCRKRWSLTNIALAMRACGLLCLKLVDTDKARGYLREALETLRLITSPNDEQTRLLAGVGNELAIVHDMRGEYPKADDLWRQMWEEVYNLEWIPIERGWRWYQRQDGEHGKDNCIAEIQKGVDLAHERGNDKALHEGIQRIQAIR